jgi:hypothetical protein
MSCLGQPSLPLASEIFFFPLVGRSIEWDSMDQSNVGGKDGL